MPIYITSIILVQRLKLNFKKWVSFGVILTCAMAPNFLLYSLFPFWQGIVIFLIGNFFLSSWLLINHWQDLLWDFKSRDINKQNPHEVAAEKLLQGLLHKAKTSSVKLKLLPKTEKITFQNLGFPYPSEIFLSEHLFENNQLNLAEFSLEALLAHELAHIKHNDTLFRIGLEFLSNLLRVSLFAFISTTLLCGIMSVGLLLPCLGCTLLVGSLIMIEVMCTKISSRARESLADLAVASLTSVSASIDSLYDYYLHYMSEQNIVIENDLGEPIAYTLLPTTYHDLEKWRKNQKGKPPKEIYVALKQIISPHETRSSWFNSHPVLHEREKELMLFERERNSFTIL